MRTHTTYVQVGGRLGFFASCMTCGCDPFPDRATRAEAEADARVHGEFRDGDTSSPPMIGYSSAATGVMPVGTTMYRFWYP